MHIYLNTYVQYEHGKGLEINIWHLRECAGALHHTFYTTTACFATLFQELDQPWLVPACMCLKLQQFVSAQPPQANTLISGF